MHVIHWQINIQFGQNSSMWTPKEHGRTTWLHYGKWKIGILVFPRQSIYKIASCADLRWIGRLFLPHKHLLKRSVTSVLEVNLTPAMTAKVILNLYFDVILSCQNTLETLVEVMLWITSPFNLTWWFGNKHKLHYRTNSVVSWKMKFQKSGKQRMTSYQSFQQAFVGKECVMSLENLDAGGYV